MKIETKIIAHSVNEFNNELITFVVTFPRFILAELNTHRMFSRNSASSRAIPFDKMVESIENNPFVPIAYQGEHKGMQGNYYYPEFEKNGIDTYWLASRDAAVFGANGLNMRGITKQLANRLLEPFMWHTAIVTTGKEGLENFFDLRCPQYVVNDYTMYDDIQDTHTFKSKKELYKCFGYNASSKDESKIYIHENDSPSRFKRGAWTSDFTEIDWLEMNNGQAEIHMMALAESMYDAYNESKPQLIEPRAWHIPYEDNLLEEFGGEIFSMSKLVPDAAYISSVMCARVSYTVAGHDLTEWNKDKYIKKAMDLADAKPLHASPFEHANKSMTEQEYKNVFAGNDFKEDGWCKNFRGFIQLRHMLENKKYYSI